MARKIIKFGGSVLKGIPRIEKVITIIQQYQIPVVLVVSAFNGITDQLESVLNHLQESVIPPFIGNLRQQHFDIIQHFIQDRTQQAVVFKELENRLGDLEKWLQGAIYIDDIPPFIRDRVLCFGEKLASLVLTAILNTRHLPFKELLPETAGFITDGTFGNAIANLNAIRNNLHNKIEPTTSYTVPGFYGISPDNKVTVFGRGGSDYTAGILASCLLADSVDLWKDVNGFMSADPDLILNPVPIRKLTYQEAAELAYFGAGILHPHTVDPVIPHNIPIRIYNINTNRDIAFPESQISASEVISNGVIKSISSTDNVAILRLFGGDIGKKPGIIARISGLLHQANINITSIITSQTTINFLFTIDQFIKAKKIVAAEPLLFIEEIVCRTNISLIAVVGSGLMVKKGIISRISGVLAFNDINVEMICQGASDVAAYFIVKKEDKMAAVRAIHSEFFEAKTNLKQQTDVTHPFYKKEGNYVSS